MSELRTAFPRITIEFCTQCKWMLRAAYFAQELLSTFSTSLGEVALQPSTGGTFTIHIYHATARSESNQEGDTSDATVVQKHLLWDRKAEGGFPETKELKRRVRDIIDPSRHLGHIDTHGSNKKPSTSETQSQTQNQSQPLKPTAGISEAGNTPDAEDTDVKSSGSTISNPKPKNEDGDENGNGNGKIQISGGGDKVFYCKPGDEDCG